MNPDINYEHKEETEKNQKREVFIKSILDNADENLWPKNSLHINLDIDIYKIDGKIYKSKEEKQILYEECRKKAEEIIKKEIEETDDYKDDIGSIENEIKRSSSALEKLDNLLEDSELRKTGISGAIYSSEAGDYIRSLRRKVKILEAIKKNEI